MFYSIEFPTNGISSNIIIAKFSEVLDTILFQVDANTYILTNYEFTFDNINNTCKYKFNNLDLETIRSHMNPICNLVGIKRGQYNIINNETNQIIDLSSITLKSILDEEDGEMTPNTNTNTNNYELTIIFDITNQALVARQIRDEAGIPLKNYFYMDTELSIDVRNTQVIITFYKNKNNFIVETLDKITDIINIQLEEYKLYDEINEEYICL